MFSFLKIGDEGPRSPLISRPRALTGAFLKAEQLPFPSQPLAEAAAVFLEQFGDFAGGFLAGPVTLQFADVGPGRYRDRPRLDHALDRHVVSFTAGATRCVGQKIDFIAIGQCREHRHLQTHFRPKAGHHQLLLAGLFHPVHDPPVFPTVEGGTVERGLLGEDVLDFLDKILSFGKGRCQKGRHVKDLCRFGDGRRIGDDLGRFVRTERQQLKVLMVDQEQAWLPDSRRGLVFICHILLLPGFDLPDMIGDMTDTILP